jgi:hypothetical protein
MLVEINAGLGMGVWNGKYNASKMRNEIRDYEYYHYVESGILGLDKGVP